MIAIVCHAPSLSLRLNAILIEKLFNPLRICLKMHLKDCYLHLLVYEKEIFKYLKDNRLQLICLFCSMLKNGIFKRNSLLMTLSEWLWGNNSCQTFEKEESEREKQKSLDPLVDELPEIDFLSDNFFFAVSQFPAENNFFQVHE